MFKSFWNDETGLEVAEYAVAAALVIAIAVVVYEVLGDAIFNTNTETGAAIEKATYTPPGGGGG